MNIDGSATRTYRLGKRAADAEDRTERIMQAALDLFVERPFDQVTLAATAERAEVGLQTLIRRVGTKDGLVAAVTAWVLPRAADLLGDPAATGGDPMAVAGALRRHYDRWAPMLDRTLRQEDLSPALATAAGQGREAHRAWLAGAFADRLAALAPQDARLLQARLFAVTGVEVWLLLTRHERLDPDLAEGTVAQLITAALAAT